MHIYIYYNNNIIIIIYNYIIIYIIYNICMQHYMYAIYNIICTVYRILVHTNITVEKK